MLGRTAFATGVAGGALLVLPLGYALLVAATTAAVHAWSLGAARAAA
ncbi:MAG TPA: hypothetical protein VI997_10875 [Candidatus Thermoplasmatota archaeon]|nr:hypothetical protein [Candidatus Thermoplasmatota archaeon]